MILIHQRHRRTDGQTGRRTTCDRNTALCTKVHRAVKTHDKKIFKTFTRGLSYSLGVSCGLFNSVLWCSAVFRHTGYIRPSQDSYNKLCKTVFGFKRFDSVTRVLMETGKPSFSTLMHNGHTTFSRCWNTCSLHNKIVGHLAALNIVVDVRNF